MISRDYEVIVYNTLDKSHRMEDKATRRSDAYSLLRSMMNTSRNACRAYPLKYENTSITGKIYLNDELLEAFRVDVFGRKRYTRVSM